MYSLKQYDWVLHLIAIAFCAFFLAKTVSTYVGVALEGTLEKGEVAAVAPVAPVAPKATLEETNAAESPYQVILDRNIFNSAASATEKEGGGETDQAFTGELGPAVKTSLDVKLLGTLVIGEGTDRRSSAVIASEKGGKGGETYYPGDEKSFAPNVKLTKIEKNRIEFVNGGRLEFVELVDFVSEKTIFGPPEEVHGKLVPETGSKAREPGAAAESGNKVMLDQADVDQALQNIDKLYTDVRIVPNFKDGNPAGMKVLSVKPGSLVSKLGIRRGDVLEKINGQELDVQKGMELFSSMKDTKSFSVDVVRGGKNQTFEYEIR